MALSTRPGKKKSARPSRLSRVLKPADMSVEEWQVALRQNFAREQRFKVQNLGDDPVFSEFAVTNPMSERTYRVTIRGLDRGRNGCTCPDFAINTLGTCKHIEFTLSRLRRLKGARKLLRQGFRPAHSEIDLRYGARREVVLTPGEEAPAGLLERARDLFDESNTLRPHRAGEVPALLALACAQGWDLRCSDAAMDFLAQMRDADYRKQRLESRYAGQPQPTILKTTLYPYQWEGALFAATAGRALLGDEMGLGKTVQALAYVELLSREFNAHGTLIICPASLKYQWKQEIEKFTDRTVTVVEGALQVRRELYLDDSDFKIVNYDVLHRDLQVIEQWAPDIVILDEAQRIKNWRTRAARAVKSIRSPYALVLTGTPLENRLEDLHSILSFVDQYRLGPLFRLLDAHQETEANSTKVIGYRNLSAIAETLRPVLLRRRKKDVSLQLPERVDRTYFVPMEREQVAVHSENREQVARLVAKWKRQKFLTEADQLRLQVALLRMRMVCDNTFLVDHKTVHGRKVDELMTVLDEYLDDPEAKVVVFSEWTRMHELVIEALERRGVGFVYLHGHVPSSERGTLVERFKNDAETRVFLSTDAGNAGLNLQVASMVVNLDLPWNPAKLEQRIGRVHRIGQRRMVQVVNFVAQGSIEHGMLSLLQFKRELFEGVLDGGQDQVTLQGSQLERFMETVEAASNATPQLAALDDLEGTAVGAHTPSAAEEPERVGPDGLQLEEPPLSGAGSAAASSAEESCEASSELAPLLHAGMAFVRELGHWMQSGSGTDAVSTFIERDPATGRAWLKVPVPEAEVVDTFLTAATALMQMLGAKAGPGQTAHAGQGRKQL